MTNDNRMPALLAELGSDAARYRALAATGAHRAHRDHRNLGSELGPLGSQEPEVGTGRDGPRGAMHQLGIRNIAIGKNHRVNLLDRE